MDKRKFLILFLILAIFVSVSAVCANDMDDLNVTAQTDTEDELAIPDDSDTLSKTELSFYDLNTKINSENSTINLEKDYKFNDATDGNFTNGINIDDDYITINGNNHYIDANYKADIFNIYGSNIVIKNLIFKNANTALYIHNNDKVETSNVTFMNCNGPNANSAVFVKESEYISNNDKFIDNNAEQGSAIYARESKLTISNGLFKTQDTIGWGLIYAIDSTYIDIINTTFVNTTSKYATAIYNEAGTTYIKKSRFINLLATFTAGSLGFKDKSDVIIEDCEFINVTSSRNGGAIFTDINYDDAQEGFVLINNTLFEDCSSGFGGACLQLGGELYIIYSRFINNYAEFSGGAVYTSNTTVGISDSLFKGNEANMDNKYYSSCGGAVFCDNSFYFEIDDSEFINNKAENGGAIYIYDTNYYLYDSKFNGNNDPIYIVFDYDDCEMDGLYGTDADDIDRDEICHENFPSVIEGEGMQITLIDQQEITELPEKYDLRELNLVSPVKDQGSMGSCWAFGMTAALESALLKFMNYNSTFSENAMTDAMLIYSPYGELYTYEGGFNLNAIAYVLSWLGYCSKDSAAYDELGKISAQIRTENDIHIQDIVLIPHEPGDEYSINNVKNAIIKYGALAAYVNSKSTSDEDDRIYYNEDTFAQYNPNEDISDHAVCLVGWDDNFKKEKFKETLDGDGAWIVKNSWGSDWGNEGYFYVSYYDRTFCAFPDKIEECFVAISLENTILYNKNYEYDFAGLSEFYIDHGETITYVNTYESTGNDVIAAVGTYFNDEGVDYDIEIYVNDELVYTQSGVSPFYGYHTIKLEKYVSINDGDYFSIAVTSNAAPLCEYPRALYKDESSIIIYEDNTWYDLNEDGEVACLKAYTLPVEIENLYDYYSEDLTYSVDVGAKGVEVNMTINGETQTVKSDKNGIAKFSLSDLEPGMYSAVLSYNDMSIISTIAISSTIDADDEVSIVYGSGSGITATFYDLNGEPLERTCVTVTYDGKTVEQLTNRQGKVTIIIGDYSKDQTVIFTNPETGEVATTKVHILPKPVIPVAPVVSPGIVYPTITPQKISLTLQKVKIKKSANKLVIKATLKINGKLANGKKVTFKFNGKKYVVKTKKGVAKLTIKKNVLKKLKAGKKLTYQVTYLKKTVKKTVKVK